MKRADEKKPTGVGGFCTGDEVRMMPGWEPVENCKPPLEMNDAALEALEEVAGKMQQWARNALQGAEKQPPGDDFGRRFIEHGGMCYFNCWSLLRQLLDATLPLSSDCPDVIVDAIIDGREFISDEMRTAGWNTAEEYMETYPLKALAEAVYIAMAEARPLALRLAERECLSAPNGPANASSTP